MRRNAKLKTLKQQSSVKNGVNRIKSQVQLHTHTHTQEMSTRIRCLLSLFFFCLSAFAKLATLIRTLARRMWACGMCGSPRKLCAYAIKWSHPKRREMNNSPKVCTIKYGLAYIWLWPTRIGWLLCWLVVWLAGSVSNEKARVLCIQAPKFFGCCFFFLLFVVEHYVSLGNIRNSAFDITFA